MSEVTNEKIDQIELDEIIKNAEETPAVTKNQEELDEAKNIIEEPTAVKTNQEEHLDVQTGLEESTKDAIELNTNQEESKEVETNQKELIEEKTKEKEQKEVDTNQEKAKEEEPTIAQTNTEEKTVQEDPSEVKTSQDKPTEVISSHEERADKEIDPEKGAEVKTNLQEPNEVKIEISEPVTETATLINSVETPNEVKTKQEKPAEAKANSDKRTEVKSNSEKRTEVKTNFLRQFRGDDPNREFKTFTAQQFMEVWNHYDDDGNGFIEGHELDGFLREFVSSVNDAQVGSQALSESAMAHFKETFMDAFDENNDNKIDITEMAEILPTDENFLLIFRLDNPLESSVDFMRIWRKFDEDCNGYIESDELFSFLQYLLKDAKPAVSEDKLREYTDTILNLFDSNKDGKLQLSEMAKLMPVKQNFLSKPILKGANCITRSDIDRLFKIYDQNQNGTIENEELNGLLKDLLDLGKKEYELQDIVNLRQIIMDHWDVDHDGQISKSELRMFLLQQCELSKDNMGMPFVQYDDEESDDDGCIIIGE